MCILLGMDTTSYFGFAQKTIEKRWNQERAWKWHGEHPWRVGCNFLPSTAINQLEMWQADTFDEVTLDRELGWLAGIGMNSMRVFLHDLLWVGDGADLLQRMDKYLSIAHRHGISTLFVFFDSCWFPFPRSGKQRDPEPGVHNSYWLQSPGVSILQDRAAFERLQPYVTGVVNRFRDDPRIEGWDVWNEPDNGNGGSYAPRDLGLRKGDVVLPLIIQAFDWVRSARPSQPVTSSVWGWQANGSFTENPLQRFQIEASDIVSFHKYTNTAETQLSIEHLKKFNRPLMCTEYMARPVGSTFQEILPLFKEHGISAYSWGAVSGKSQTIYPWASWQEPSPIEPPVWFHDVLRKDGTPYIAEEAATIRRLTAK